MPVELRKIINNLKLLPTIAFSLLLGAGLVMTGFTVWFVTILNLRAWPVELVAVIFATGLVNALYISLGLIGLVICVLAFGKLKNLAVTAPNGIGANLSFDESPDN